ncbi:unnamed protein product, partial [Mesorhabditis spiculigera]
MDVLRKAVQSIIQIDGQMNQLERTIGKSFNEDRMLDGSINIAQSTGRSMSEVNGNLIGFANQGFNESDTLSLGKAASVLQNISNLTPGDSVNTLTGAMAAFNIEANKSMGIADKLKEVSGNYGVSSKDLALSLTSAGAAAKSFGVSIEELLGNTAAISSITRESGDVVGRGLKAIYTRVGSDEQSAGVLQSVGISKADKDVITVLDELAGKWNQLTKAQQQNTAFSLAGQDQTTTFTALMQNWQTSVNASESALHSQGAAMKDNEQYMGSLGARIQNMQTAWESLTLALGNALVSDSIITITSLVTEWLMNKFSNATQATEDFSDQTEALNQKSEFAAQKYEELRQELADLNQEFQQDINIKADAIKGGKLNADQTVKYTNTLKDLNIALIDNNSAMSDVNERLKALRENAADKIIEDFKKVIEQQRDFAIDAIDEQRKAEDERHKERNKHLDDEQKKFETYINARLKALDRENSSVDYEEELTKKKNERQKIVDKLNVLSLDNSMEAKAKRKDLTEQLTTVDEEIATYERDRERELVKQGLQDQLNDHKNYTDKLKEEDSDLHETTLANLDDEKKKTERYYKDILEDQKYFYDLKQGLMSNDAAVVTAKLTEIGDSEYWWYDSVVCRREIPACP